MRSIDAMILKSCSPSGGIVRGTKAASHAFFAATRAIDLAYSGAIRGAFRAMRTAEQFQQGGLR
jgi:hypothetical protein